MMNKIEVYVCEPGNKQFIQEIENTVEAMQNLIDGYFEIITIPQLSKFHIYLIVDEEGSFKGKERSLWIDTTWIVGTCFFAKQKGIEFATLSEEDKKLIESYISNG